MEGRKEGRKGRRMVIIHVVMSHNPNTTYDRSSDGRKFTVPYKASRTIHIYKTKIKSERG